MYDSSAGGSGGWETKRGRSYEQKRRNINSSSQWTITCFSRFTVFLSYCVNETLRSGAGGGGEGSNFPKAVSQNLGLNPHSLLCTSRWAFKKWIVNLVQMANWNTRCILRDVISPKWPDNRNKGMSKP